MDITSSSILIERTEGSNKFLRVRYAWTDGSGMVLDSFVPQTQDTAAWIAARIPELEAQAASDEIEHILRTP